MLPTMGSPARSPLSSPGWSPSFRHARTSSRQSPVEIKERMRKSYKERIHNSRNQFFNSMRETGTEADLRDTLSRVLSDLFHHEQLTPEDEEYKLLENIREELIHAEMSWLLEEYEKVNMDNIDWALMEPEDDVICPTCQKVNLVQMRKRIMCPTCKWCAHTEIILSQLKKEINDVMDNHSKTCSNQVGFSSVAVAENNNIHIYLICNLCSDMAQIL